MAHIFQRTNSETRPDEGRGFYKTKTHGSMIWWSCQSRFGVMKSLLLFCD